MIYTVLVNRNAGIANCFILLDNNKYLFYSILKAKSSLVINL